MSAELRAELFKQRTVQTGPLLLSAMACLVLLAVLLHGFGLPAENFDSRSEQITTVFGWGEVFGALFAALFGAMSMTSEVSHGTIRPTFLVTPQRRQVVIAKVWAGMLIGTGFGLVAATIAAGIGTAALRGRGIEVRLDAGDYTLLVVGGSVAAGLWAALGVGLGAVVRNQVPALVGICVWLLFVENLLVGDVANFVQVGRFLPGAAAKALSGQDPNTLLAPGISLVLLVLYSVAVALVGSVVISRRDV